MDPVVGGVVATVSRALDVPGGHTLQLQYPRSLPEEVVQQTVIPAVEGGVRILASIQAAVRRAVVTTYLENKIQISYLGAQAEVLRRDIIPVIAAVEAHQTGRNYVRSRGLDRDLEVAALAEMRARLERRFGDGVN